MTQSLDKEIYELKQTNIKLITALGNLVQEVAITQTWLRHSVAYEEAYELLRENFRLQRQEEDGE